MIMSYVCQNIVPPCLLTSVPITTTTTTTIILVIPLIHSILLYPYHPLPLLHWSARTVLYLSSSSKSWRNKELEKKEGTIPPVDHLSDATQLLVCVLVLKIQIELSSLCLVLLVVVAPPPPWLLV